MVTGRLPSPESTREHSHIDTVGSPRQIHRKQSSVTPSFTQNIPIDSFPVFASGDVFIRTDLVSSTKYWQLHSVVLARHSPWFAESLQPSLGMLDTAWYLYIIKEVGGKVELTRQVTEGGAPNFSILQNDNTTNTINVKSEGTEEDAPPEAAADIYNMIFGAFYNVIPQIAANNIKVAMSKVEELVGVARHLGCTHLVTSHIGNALVQHRQSLYRDILADAPRYLLLSLALENVFFYTEALIHLVGAYPSWPWPSERTALPEDTLQLIANKSRELDTKVLEVERELLLTITTSRGTPYSAGTYSQFDTWFVVQLFRDTLTNVFRQHDASRPSLKRGSLFRKIKAGGSTYMAYEDVRRIVLRVMPSAVETLDEDLKILKEYASDIVADLARNESNLDVEEHKVG
ncbi:hypothetical protein EJ07DRAFT_175262 [Lizonia empirigonia]|nr:hypothetical protein EJ07DRAFT_175262 [Lizonia empirigonia]